MSDALKGLLGDDLYNQVLEKSGLKPNEFDLLKNYVPRSRLNEATEIKKQLEGKVTDFESQLKETKKMLSDNEDFKNKYSSLEEKYNNDISIKDIEIVNITKRSKLENKLIAEGAKHVELLLPKINLNNIKIDGDSLIGADDSIKLLKENYKDLFTTTNSNTNIPPVNNQQQNNNNNNSQDGLPTRSFFDGLINK